MAETTIDSSRVTADFGAYYIAGGQGENDIHERIMEPFGTLEAFTVVETSDTILRTSSVEFTELLQSFQTAFTPKGSVTFTPKAIPLFNVKMDTLVFPDKLGNNWLAFLKSKSLDRSTWPFVRWLVEVYIMKQMNKDLEMTAIYGGSYLAPTAGTAGNAINIMDGLKKLINAELAGPAVVIPTGAFSTDPVTFCTQIETFCAAIPENYWTEKLQLNISRAGLLLYRQGREKKYNMAYQLSPNLDTVQNFPNVTLVARDSLRGKQKIWTTPTLNAVLAMNAGANRTTVRIEQVDRQVKIYTDWWMGAGFIDGRILFTNDQDLT